MSTSEFLKNQVSIHRQSNECGIETMMAHYVRHRFKRHAHDEFIVGLMASGVHDVWFRGERPAAGRGTGVTMNPGDIHYGGAGADSGWIQRMFYVTEATMDAVVEDVTDRGSRIPPRFDEAFRVDEVMADRMAAVHDAIHSQSLRLARDVLLSDLIGSVVARFASMPLRPSRDPGFARLERASEYLRDHVEDDVSLARLASIVGLRKRQTINLFNKHLGLPPHAYHLTLKINAIKRQLRTGASIADCAAAFGFVDQSHMTRHFRAVVGITPKDYAVAT